MPGLFFCGKGYDIGKVQCNPENIDSQLTAALLGSFRQDSCLPSFQGHAVVKEKKKCSCILKKSEFPKSESYRKRHLAVFSANLKWLFHFDVWGKPLIFLSGNCKNSPFLYMTVPLLILICTKMSEWVYMRVTFTSKVYCAFPLEFPFNFYQIKPGSCNRRQISLKSLEPQCNKLHHVYCGQLGFRQCTEPK